LDKQVNTWYEWTGNILGEILFKLYARLWFRYVINPHGVMSWALPPSRQHYDWVACLEVPFQLSKFDSIQ
jgi:hypothetical protein